MAQDDSARVLVVDDEPLIRELLTDALRQGGLDVYAAGSTQEAMELAARSLPDLVVADLCLGDSSGLDVIDRLRRMHSDMPAVVITGLDDARALSEATGRRPLEVLHKPLDLDRLRRTIFAELVRQERSRRSRGRALRLRRLARQANIERKSVRRRLEQACRNLNAAYESLNGQLASQKVLVGYQGELLSARNDDDVFRTLFGVLVRQSGALFGLAMACDSNAELQLVGRFGVPKPDSAGFCRELARPLIGSILNDPRSVLIDAQNEIELFDQSIRRYLVGVTVLALPLMPADGELIGLVVLYRKGEQPFTDHDVALCESLAAPTALAVRRND